MPIFRKSDPLIDRMVKSAPRGQTWYHLDYSLPDFSALQNAALGSLGEDALQKDWNEKHAVNFGQGVQAQAGSILANIGAPMGTNLLSGLVNIVKIDNPGMVIFDQLMGFAEKILEEALDQMMEIIEEILSDVFSSAFDVIGSIPIIGNILDIAMSVSRIIIDVIEMKRQKKELGEPEQEFKSAGVSPTADLLIANQKIMNKINGSKDWTGIFMPRGHAEDGQDNFHSIKLDMTGGKARRFTVVDERKGWVGFVPGTIQTDNMWEINTYEHRVGWPSFVGGQSGRSGVARSLGSLLPTTRDMGLLCWSQVNGSKAGASTSMFCVDAETAIDEWKEFLYQFRMWLKTGGTGGGLSQWSEVRVSESGLKKFVDELSGQDGFYGWSKWDSKYDPKKRYANFGINKSHPIQALKNLRDRQRAFLHQVDVAYVGPDYGAVKHNSEMRELWKKNRSLLLQHPARRFVDVNNIPDLEYRNAMEYAKSDLIPQHKGTLTAYPVSPLGNGGNAPPPYQPGGKADIKTVKATISGEAKKRKSGKGGSLVLIALGLGLLAVAKGKK